MLEARRCEVERKIGVLKKEEIQNPPYIMIGFSKN
jgi:hypothetical protein